MISSHPPGLPPKMSAAFLLPFVLLPIIDEPIIAGEHLSKSAFLDE